MVEPECPAGPSPGPDLVLSGLALVLGLLLARTLLALLTVSIEVSGPMKDCSVDLYAALLAWVPGPRPHSTVSATSAQDEAGRTRTTLAALPAFAHWSWFRHGGTWVLLSRRRLGRDGVIMDEVPWEALTLTALRPSRSVLDEILAEVKGVLEADRRDEGRTKFFVAAESYWAEFGTGRRNRPLSSVILNEAVMGGLVGDVEEFLRSRDWYRDRGIPYRRGYLLYGPPGCGKSSFVKALAGRIRHNISILSLSAKNLTDDRLNGLMNSTEENSILLLEDVDAAFPSREPAEAGGKKGKGPSAAGTGKVTLRGLLNALDGVASTEGRILFLTTNYVQRLDPAMTRPGRVDMKVHVGWPDEDQLGRMFRRFYPEAAEGEEPEFLAGIRGLAGPVSMAMVQGLFMVHKAGSREMIDKLGHYFTDQFFFEVKEED